MQTKKTLDKDWLQAYPRILLAGLFRLAARKGGPLYVAGGAVREWLGGRSSRDLDLTVPSDAFGWAEELATDLKGAFVPLDEKEGVARVVWNDISVDFSQYRGEAKSLEEDLRLRDFTINALAVAFDSDQAGLQFPYKIIDPNNGIRDFQNKLIKATNEEVFSDDPLRMLRAYRFMAQLQFKIDPATEALIHRQSQSIIRCAGERVAAEMGLILASDLASDAVNAMHGVGLLTVLFPELASGAGMEQPPSHHLDVLDHNLETLARIEKIMTSPDLFFPGRRKEFEDYLQEGKTREMLKWAALFHDLGKPETRQIRSNRLTFHNHDLAGGRLFAVVTRRLAWSNKNREKVCRLIDLHMWPFHLSNVFRREGRVTPKACLRLVKAADLDLNGVFLLAMADSLAGQGPKKPANMESSVARLYEAVEKASQHHIKPVLAMPRLLNGHDLQKEFELTPGPIFSTLFVGLEEAQVAGEVNGRSEALTWVRAFLAQQKGDF